MFNENCQIQDDTFMPLPSRTIDNVKLFNDKYELPSENTVYLVALGELSEFKGQALNYISGFIQKKIYEKEQCINCKLYIANLRIVNSSALLNIKNRGGLTKPSPAIEKIVRVSETVFSDLIKDGRNFFLGKKTCWIKLLFKLTKQS